MRARQRTLAAARKLLSAVQGIINRLGRPRSRVPYGLVAVSSSRGFDGVFLARA